MSGQAYVYNEDSLLMGCVLAEIEGGKSFLEIGTGNGGNLREVVSKFDLIVGTDITSLVDTKRSNPSAELIVADRANCFRSCTFDVVAFNPPYVPTDSISDSSIDGGVCGIEVPLQFLESAKRVVKKEGRILILLSSESNETSFREYCLNQRLKAKKVGEKPLFFESLKVFELTSISDGGST